jgi:hypothetical protein
VPKFNTELGFTHSLAKFSEKFGNHLLVVLVLFIGLSVVGISKLSVYLKRNHWVFYHH